MVHTIHAYTGNKPKLFVILKHGDLSKYSANPSELTYVGHRIGNSEEEVLKHFVSKDELMAVEISEFENFQVKLVPKENENNESL